ncbi:hypothetical protein DID76_01195 [Candidatus Marinamargulisbacteria bacterium SCGC AG-414-C22]|nr:hypothetical protein DID76_01195 [Candidatus Marinamargulisbacteria bacterium SCGC AG-414-C22]
MSEGTKLGEIKESSEEGFESFSTSTEDDLSATRLGEVSEFEKSLISDQPELKVEKKVPEKKEPVKVEKSEVNDLAALLEQEMEKPSFDFQEGDVITATVRLVEKAGTIIDFNYKSDGFISNAELGVDEKNNQEKLVAGQTVQVFIEKLETKEGYTLMSRKKAQLEESWDTLTNASNTKDIVSVHIVSKVEGGLVTSYKGIRGFIPASQVFNSEETPLDSYVGQQLDAGVLQVDRRRRKVIFSNKIIKKYPSKVELEKLLEDLEVGQTRSGKVTSIKDFGVFVDIGGIEGLVHISELSWLRVRHPSDLVEVGDDVSVFILGIDKANRKISLGMKQLEADPWVSVSEKYKVGQVVDGVITRLVTFGAFIKLEERLEGLVHISEMSHDRVEKVEDVVKVGDTVKAKIIKLLIEEQKIGLSLKNTAEDPVENVTEEVVNNEDTEISEESNVENTEEAPELVVSEVDETPAD